MNRWEDKFLQATMLDLIRRKRIKYEIISNEKFHQDKKLTQVDNDKDSLADYEFILLHRMIFDVKKSITLKDLNKQFRESHDHFKKIFQELKNSINKEMKNLGYFDKSSDEYRRILKMEGISSAYERFFQSKSLCAPISYYLGTIFGIRHCIWYCKRSA
jgi:fumarylacetoacetate (FAA) hydrolase family protein